MTLSPNHRLFWAGLDKVAWDNVGSQSVLQHEFYTPGPRGAVGVTRAQPGASGLCVLWARHSSWSAPLVLGTDLLFDLGRVQVPLTESRWDMDPADGLTERELHKMVVAAILPLSSLS